jgi:hypothetical protein
VSTWSSRSTGCCRIEASTRGSGSPKAPSRRCARCRRTAWVPSFVPPRWAVASWSTQSSVVQLMPLRPGTLRLGPALSTGQDFGPQPKGSRRHRTWPGLRLLRPRRTRARVRLFDPGVAGQRVPVRRHPAAHAAVPHAPSVVAKNPVRGAIGLRDERRPSAEQVGDGTREEPAEKALLRQQLVVAERRLAGRVRWAPWQRFTMALAARIAPTWRSVTLLVQPATVVRSHRTGFRVFWRAAAPTCHMTEDSPEPILASIRPDRAPSTASRMLASSDTCWSQRCENSSLAICFESLRGRHST